MLFIIILSVLLIANNIIVKAIPIQVLFNIIYLSLIVYLSTEKGRNQEKYSEFDYDYNQENPNALVSGENIAGTVYASYPGNTGGLGWIL